MSIVAIFSGMFCNGNAVTRNVIQSTGFRRIAEDCIIDKAARLSGISGEKIRRAFTAKTSIFNAFTHEKKFSIACLRMALAEELEKGPAVVHGFTSLLIPRSIPHLFRVCITGDTAYRLELAKTLRGVPQKEALHRLQIADGDSSSWTELLFGNPDPWSEAFYDLVVPINQMDAGAAAARIQKKINNKITIRTEGSTRREKDFLLAAAVEVALFKAGHTVSVTAKNGSVTLTINHQVLMLARLEKELAALAGAISGVHSVTIQVGNDSDEAHIYRQYTSDLPSRVLLVDDEREFVQTLSERLQLRNMGSVVAFDGESALRLVEEDDPEVMILDLKMPGMDGMEILKQVKSTRPGIEVIILTGHGSETDREQCMKLGAFAYMQKPADIDQLSETLKKAHEHIQQCTP